MLQPRSVSTTILTCALVVACTKPTPPADRSGEVEPDAPADVDRSEVARADDDAQEPVNQMVDMSAKLQVTGAEAEAAGLPRLGFALTLTNSGMSGSRLEYGRYATLSGPPGGPLSLLISPASVGAAFADHVGGDQVLDARLVEQEVELLGAKRRAAAWITGEGLARTSWCAILVAPEGAGPGDPALLLELGVGQHGDDVSCSTAREHHVLKPVVDSFELLTD